MNISGESIYRGSTLGRANCDGERRTHLQGHRVPVSAHRLVDGEYVYSGTTKLGGPIANVSGGGRMSAAAAAVYLLLM